MSSSTFNSAAYTLRYKICIKPQNIIMVWVFRANENIKCIRALQYFDDVHINLRRE